MPDVYGYRNVVTGDRYLSGAERPDLEARPNFERFDVDQDKLTENLKGQLAGAAREAQMRIEAARTTENMQTALNEEAAAQDGTGLIPMGVDEPDSFVAQRTPETGIGGVLSRNVVRGRSQQEIQAQNEADSEALALHGVLASNLDGSEQSVALPDRNVVVESSPPVGEPGRGAKRAAAAAKKRATPTAEKLSETQAPQNKTA